MHTGKLYRCEEEQFVTDVSYRLISEAATTLCGELIPTDYGCVRDDGDYIVELEDRRKIKCNLRKNVNRGVIGVPPRFVYRFAGTVAFA